MENNPVPTIDQQPFADVPAKKGSKALIFSLIIILFLIIGIGGYFLLSKSNIFTKSKTSITSSKETSVGATQFRYLSKPTFGNSVPTSSFAKPSDYSVKNSLPSADEVAKKSKLSLLPNKNIIPVAYAGGGLILPVYRAARHQFTKEDAIFLAQKFGFLKEPKKEGFDPPAYYAFTWDNNEEFFQVSGGSGTGGFEYYIKNPVLTGKAPSDNEAIDKAKTYLMQKGIIDDSYIASGVLYNVGSIAKRSGFNEDHKQVYFRKKLAGYPVYDWTKGEGSPITDKLDIWVGVGGRIIYAANESYWTTVNLNNKADYLVREPSAVFEDIKAGKGKLAWIDYNAINIANGGYGPSAPVGNFALHGKLTNVVVEDVQLAYYHEAKGVDEPEYYQPIYLFNTQATLDWKDDYKVSYEGEKFIQGKRTSVTIVAPAISDNYFFETPVTLAGDSGNVSPTSIPSPITSPTNQSGKQIFLLKLGATKDLDDPKRNVYLDWSNVPGTVKYNVYLKIAGDKDYNQTPIDATGSLSDNIGVNKYISYYFKVQACSNADNCIESNEVFLPQEQKQTTFLLKLGVATLQDDPKINVYIDWSNVPGTGKYNIYLRTLPIAEYGEAIASTGELNYTAGVNKHNDNYFMVQACKAADACISSNEVFLPKQ